MAIFKFTSETTIEANNETEAKNEFVDNSFDFAANAKCEKIGRLFPGDKGHEDLIDDLTVLMRHAERYEFHDFKNSQFATPKVALKQILDTLASKAINGKYDNDDYKPTSKEIMT